MTDQRDPSAQQPPREPPPDREHDEEHDEEHGEEHDEDAKPSTGKEATLDPESPGATIDSPTPAEPNEPA